MFIEYYQPFLASQTKLLPKHLDQMIPTVAKFHALTFENRFLQDADIFDPWLPLNTSKSKMIRKSNSKITTMEYLDQAIKEPSLKDTVGPMYSTLQKILPKRPIFFPRILAAGLCLLHGDLHTHNICCKNPSDHQNWEVQLIYWESAKYAPCWNDLVVRFELLIDIREDWHKNADEIRSHCVHLYS
ncbi:MAG: hypothetical protein ACQEWV_28030 [Bacillota bacterium]